MKLWKHTSGVGWRTEEKKTPKKTQPFHSDILGYSQAEDLSLVYSLSKGPEKGPPRLSMEKDCTGQRRLLPKILPYPCCPLGMVCLLIGWKTHIPKCSQPKRCLDWIYEVCSTSPEWVICSTNKQTNKNKSRKEVWAVTSVMGLISLHFLWVWDFNVSSRVGLMIFHKSWSSASTFLSGHLFIYSLTL